MTANETEQRPDYTRQFDGLIEFMNMQQAMVGRHVNSLNRPLQKLSEEELAKFLERLNAYLAFEIQSENDVEGEVAVCVRGNGLVIATDKHGKTVGSEVIDHHDVVVGKVSSLVVQKVPTVDTVLEAQMNPEMTTVADFMISVVAVLEDGVMYVGVDNDGNFMREHDLGGYDLHIGLAYPLQFSPIATSL